MMSQLDAENRELDDPAVFARLAELTRKQQRPVEGILRRGQHAKPTGLADADFIVSDDVAEELRCGVFERPGAVFRACVRFSDSQGTFEPDGTGTARGAAIKLFEVEGPRAIPFQTETTQDFLMVNHPVFPFSDPADYLKAIERRGIPIIGGLAITAYLALEDREALKTVRAIRGKRPTSVFAISYWSGTPYWLGTADGVRGQAVKYSLVPRPALGGRGEAPEDPPDDYLRQDFVARLGDDDVVFDFKVQPQKGTMKIEDATDLWDEHVSEPVTVATLRIPRQDSEAIDAAGERCEPLSFNPWHVLASHRPMGGLNRLRRAVYEASFSNRGGR